MGSLLSNFLYLIDSVITRIKMYITRNACYVWYRSIEGGWQFFSFREYGLLVRLPMLIISSLEPHLFKPREGNTWAKDKGKSEKKGRKIKAWWMNSGRKGGGVQHSNCVPARAVFRIHLGTVVGRGLRIRGEMDDHPIQRVDPEQMS
jgi:hypothetical protein